jgi:hypothetical protein
MIAFMISGSSVAIGESSSAVTAAGRPSIGPIASSWRTNSCEAAKMTARAATVWVTTAQVAGRGRCRCSRADAAGLGDRIRTIEADLDQTWPDLGPTDVIWAASSMHHMADPGHALASAFGAVRCGRAACW